jgi:hypothetical protein
VVVANGSENSIPSYFIKAFSISVPAHPYTTHMIFVQTPSNGCLRVMAVVTHHPIVILFECVVFNDSTI